MSDLFANLKTSATALAAFERSLEVAQNNVANASTAGYAKQVPTLDALSFQPQNGLPGGVKAGDPQSTRDEYLEQAVRYQTSVMSNFQAQAQALGGIEPIFDVTGQSGIVAALNNMFQSFSAWSASPDSAEARQDVLSKAQDLGASFQQAMATLSSATTNISNKIDTSVTQINSLASQVLAYNLAQNQGQGPDAGLDAHLHDTLETLNGLAGVTARFESDGTVTLLMGGQTPLVIGSRQYALKTAYFGNANPVNPNATPAAHILDSTGQDVTANVVGGSLGGLLAVRNTILPSLQGDGQQTGALNQIAKRVADRVNQLLGSGLTPGGQAGTPLFTYDASSAANAARTLAINLNITTDTLAALDPGPPQVANGIALSLAGLGESQAAGDTIGGKSILEFLNAQTQIVGRQVSDANAGQTVAQQSLAQAKAVRTQVSGVSLDEEAVRVMELQRGYQAISKMLTVIDGLTDTLLNMVN
ncbi:MAG TPA: flagellar hook-associated protein FlgK [Bryobacteraceae bacterium]|nr:flagellar hook-associated protein FlgK [Bryobacteraceae bacterium]